MDLLVLVHRTVAYPFAFLLAPAALLTFAGAPGHRRLGKAYLYVMTFLYATGSVVTLTGDWGTWGFARNVAFNLFGFSLVLFGARAMLLFRRPGHPSPARLDYGLAALLFACTGALIVLGLFRDTPVRVFAGLGVLLCWIELKELRAGFRPRAVLYDRHVRYILASYFYVLTVASIVHLGDELSRDAKWLWPAAIGILVVASTTTRARWIWRRRRVVLRSAIALTVLLALGFGGYAMMEVARELRGGPAIRRER